MCWVMSHICVCLCVCVCAHESLCICVTLCPPSTETSSEEDEEESEFSMLSAVDMCAACLYSKYWQSRDKHSHIC